MANIEHIRDLFNNVCSDIVRTPISWQSFLGSACYNYRLPFDEQVLVFAQRPDARAVLEFDKWNNRFHRKVNRGAKGIAVIDDRADTTKLKYYFDISDTSERENSRPVPIWQYQSEYESDVVESLVDNYSVDDNADIYDAVWNSTENLVQDNMADYLSDLLLVKEDSYLEDFDADMTESVLRIALHNSIAFMVMSRLGLDTDKYFDSENFAGVLNFNTLQTISVLGNATSDIAEMELSELSKTILSLNRTFAQNKDNEYTKTEIDNERGVTHDSNLHTSGQLPNSEFGNATRHSDDSQQVWQGSQELPQGESQVDLSSHVDTRNAGQSLEGNSAGSTPNGGELDDNDGSARGLDRTAQGNGHDGLGSGNEQPSTESSRASDEQADLSNVNELPPFLDEDAITYMLSNPDDALSDKKPDIVEYFVTHKDYNDRQEYVKSIYPERYNLYQYNDGYIGWVPNENGLLMWEGNYLTRTKESVFSWGVVSEYIANAIDNHTYYVEPIKVEEPKEPTAQIGLFDFVDAIPMDDSINEVEQVSLFNDFGVSQQIVDEALCCGFNDTNSRIKIAMHFRSDRGVEYNAETLKKLYDTNGAGFIFNGEQVSFWYNENGIDIAKGTTAQKNGATHLTWEQAAIRIRELLDVGRYMPQYELDKVDDYELEKVADLLTEFIRSMPEEYVNRDIRLKSIKDKTKDNGSYPERKDIIKGMLVDDEQRQVIFDEYADYMADFNAGMKVINYRYAYGYNVEYVNDLLEGMKREPIHFKAEAGFLPDREMFISQDEIDKQILGGEHRHEHRLATYTYFVQHPDRTERVKYVGRDNQSGYAGGNDHRSNTSKGIEFSHGSIMEPYAKVFVKWSEVAKRIDTLIKQNKFVTQEDIDAIPEIYKDHIAQALETFFSSVREEDAKPYSDDIKPYEIKKVIKAQLDNPQALDDIEVMMSNAMVFKDKEDRMYSYYKQRYNDFVAYKNGTFKLYEVPNLGPKPKQPSKFVAQPTEKETVNERADEIKALNKMLDELKIDDVSLSVDNDVIVAKDSELTWQGKEFYEFITDDCLAFNADGTLQEGYSVNDETLKTFLEYAKGYGVEPELQLDTYSDFYKAYSKVKADYPEHIMFYQLGDFYEVLGDDAKAVANELDLVLTSRTINFNTNERMPMCGIPRQSLDNYTKQLVELGYKVAIAELQDGERVTETKELRDPMIDEALNYIHKYKEREFEQDNDEYDDLSDIGLAYTTTEDDICEIDVNCSLVDFTITQRVDGRVVEVNKFTDLDDMIKSGLEYMTFDELIYVEPNVLMAVRLVEHLKNTDFYDYQDNLEIGETDEDAIAKISEQIKDKFFCDGVVAYMTDHIADEAIDIHEAEVTGGNTEQSLETLHEHQKLLDDFRTYVDEYVVQTQEIDLDLIGEEVDIDGRHFVVESVENGYVSMADKTFADGTGFPIFRRETVDFVKQYLPTEEKTVDKSTERFELHFGYSAPHENDKWGVIDNSTGDYYIDDDQLIHTFDTEKEAQAYLDDVITKHNENINEKIIPVPKARKNTRTNWDIHPDIPLEQRHDFDFAAHPVEEVGKREHFRRNMEAIRVLKECEFDDRFATPEEQIILSKYVGWGGLPEAFDENNSSWADEYKELIVALSPDEYEAARESTLTAFYTPQTVIKACYDIANNLGFKQGNILEPSCGIGNFIGMLPKSMADSSVYAVELDKVSAAIAQQLYQTAHIVNNGYEKTNVPDNFYDMVTTNVPFGDFKVLDKKYDKYHPLIHDYFFMKSLDKVRTGGIMIFITSKGTMDKENSNIRKYIAQRADLLGAIRLPNDTFKGNAGTEVVSDILILQKRDRMIDIEPDWVQLDNTEDGIRMNKYFVDNPDMVLGNMEMVSGRFGPEPTCLPYEDRSLEELLEVAVQNIQGQITEVELDEELDEDLSIPSSPDVRNFSYTIVDGKIYFRENSRMTPADVSATAENRIKGMIAIRDSTRKLIELQTDDYPEEDILDEQRNLNELYNKFTAKYGLINSRANKSAFGEDASYHLISALEVLGENGTLERKADMFTKRTIKPHIPVTEVDTPSEALAVSMGERAKVDMEYMSELCHKTEKEIYDELQGVIFLNPEYNADNPITEKYLMADEYLSGNVRVKLRYVTAIAKEKPEYQINVEALQKVQPKDLTASEIDVRLGATWLPTDVVQDFVFNLLETPFYHRYNIKVNFSPYSGDWNITNKTADRGNVKANSTYGTGRINAYQIIEQTLNLKDVRIFDYEIDDNGKKKPILNKKETAIAMEKQDAIKQAFRDWVWNDPDRRTKLCAMYNDKFNSIRPREYDGSHLIFPEMNPEITLRPHQLNAVAHSLYGGNTLLAHAVGAGKTFEMIAIAEESIRLGLSSKCMIVVPNHLTEQWGADILTLYPNAKLLVATKKDFEKKNRRRFLSRIATGDYDIIVIGHSQFEKIPMSVERQQLILQRQLDEIVNGIAELKYERGQNFTVKQLEKAKKSIQAKLDKLNDQDRKDDIVTFEELGVDRLFVDEAHYFKNLYLYTKMRNVGGIAQTEAQKSSDLFMKTQYLDEITGGRGVVFATGTPISNSMVELYTMQRYLQYNTLRKHDLQHFDSWASTFGETITAIELTPEGTGYRPKTRFAKFYNLPELMAMFKEVADIQTADMLKLPVPEAEYINVAVKPSDIQVEMVKSLSERAEKVRGGGIDSSKDNMLLITNDGRKLALDQRMIDPLLPDFEGSKVNALIENVYRIWKDTTPNKSTQLIFCDLSTPKSNGEFSVYNDIRDKLIAMGVPADEVQFIHDANTETKKADLFKKVRTGDVRILMGSTQKMGAGTNVQDKLIAMHDLDCPWRPSDLEQRAGRIVRQGNENDKVQIYRYVTEQTFDAYLYQLVEGKQKFASQIMSSKSPVRSAEDIDETALSYAEIKMLATGNPHIKEKMDLDIQVQKLRMLKSNFLSERYALEDKVIKDFPRDIARHKSRIEGLEKDIVTASEHPKSVDDTFIGMVVNGVKYDDKADAGQAIIDVCKTLPDSNTYPLGEYRGFKMEVHYEPFSHQHRVDIRGAITHQGILGSDPIGNITRIDNVIDGLDKVLESEKAELSNTEKQLEIAKEQLEKPFSRDDELKQKEARLSELNALLNVDKRENEIVNDDNDVGNDSPQRSKVDRESR